MTPRQMELTAPELPAPDPTKVLIARADLLKHAKRLHDEGKRQAANAIRCGCIGQGEFVPVSRALVDRWGLVNG